MFFLLLFFSSDSLLKYNFCLHKRPGRSGIYFNERFYRLYNMPDTPKSKRLRNSSTDTDGLPVTLNNNTEAGLV
ncbi:hypothetical protein SKAU_G00425330 [Synaphobranchus kaupii]|uniref:Uncharacterized protein n=1 Tax=Synaphobranchus kaupii TaxID=118154 RepID=A0A9Q1IAR1_SYNKA|nr:hypothetical protein SKAU_G00425330 [Synaphobranchus kaupii]